VLLSKTCCVLCVVIIVVVPGCIALAKSLEPAGAARDLRTCIEEALIEKLDLVENGIPYSASHPDIVFRDQVLDRLLGSTPSDEKRKAILRFHFNGGILKSLGPSMSRATIARVCAKALLPAPIPIWKRSRWAKTSRPLREVALLFSMNGLAERALQKWLGSALKPPSAPLPMLLDLARDPGPDATDYIERNKQARLDALSWSRSHPGPRLMILVSGLSSGIDALDQKLVRGSVHTQRQQMFHLASSSVAPDLNIVASAKGIDAKQLFTSLHDQFWTEEFWGVLPCSEHTHGAASVAFAVLSRQAVGMHHHFGSRSSAYPWKLWRILDEPDMIDQVLADPWCIKDDFARGFLTRYSSKEKLLSDSCRTVLIAMALTIRVDTYPLENRFGWMRRFKGLATTTHEQELVGISSHFLNTRQRLIESSWLKRRCDPGDPHRSGDADEGEDRNGAEDSAPMRGGGGPWRAFVSEFFQLEGCRGDFRRAAELYRDIKADGEDEWQRLQHKGRIGAEAHRAGGASFASCGVGASASLALVPLLQAMQQGRHDDPNTTLAVVSPAMHMQVSKDWGIAVLESPRKQKTSLALGWCLFVCRAVRFGRAAYFHTALKMGRSHFYQQPSCVCVFVCWCGDCW
jgi:hypothetical protein